MATEIVRPDATVAAGGATIGGGAGSLHAATSDDSDTTYAILDGAATTLGFDEPVGTGLLKAVHVRVRCGRTPIAGLTNPVLFVSLGGESKSLVVNWATPQTVTFIFDPDRVDVADVELSLGLLAGPDLRAHEVYMEFVTIDQPVATVTGPTGTLTDTNLPTITWTMS